ncbi:hypothetical protein BSL78_15606 [Apostichopus japonicus]|uniref:Uncharacterized protein n=1 Tax=Stichopus japonicus TaxID=307972 RepID=A0A2G8KHP9_STIJA|nr:hypothetical protein BSL78_15606 [Apostichopus japonicus]
MSNRLIQLPMEQRNHFSGFPVLISQERINEMSNHFDQSHKARPITARLSSPVLLPSHVDSIRVASCINQSGSVFSSSGRGDDLDHAPEVVEEDIQEAESSMLNISPLRLDREITNSDCGCRPYNSRGRPILSTATHDTSCSTNEKALKAMRRNKLPFLPSRPPPMPSYRDQPIETSHVIFISSTGNTNPVDNLSHTYRPRKPVAPTRTSVRRSIISKPNQMDVLPPVSIQANKDNKNNNILPPVNGPMPRPPGTQPRSQNYRSRRPKFKRIASDGINFSIRSEVPDRRGNLPRLS